MSEIALARVAAALLGAMGFAFAAVGFAQGRITAELTSYTTVVRDAFPYDKLQPKYATGLVIPAGDAPFFMVFAIPSTEAYSRWVLNATVSDISIRLEPKDFVGRLGNRMLAARAILSPGELVLSFDGGPGVVEVLSRTTLKAVTSEQIHGGDSPSLEYLSVLQASGRTRETALLKSVATLVHQEHEDSGGVRKVSSCTAFHIGAGIFLSNAHCVAQRARCRVSCANNDALNEGVYLLRPASEDNRHSGVQARLEHVGCDAIARDGPVDYAILSAPELANLPRIDVSSAPAITINQASQYLGARLEIYQMWHGAAGKAYGAAMSTDAFCNIESMESAGTSTPTPATFSCPLPAFRHKCDAESGSSGSPLVIAGTNTILGLHFWGTSTFNCGLLVRDALRHAANTCPSLKLHSVLGK